MTIQQLVTEQDSGVQEIQIGSIKGIETPVFAPEIKGKEDLKAILSHLHILEEGNPILVPGYRWPQIRNSEFEDSLQENLKKLLQRHPIFLYDPPELFRYRKGGSIVTYALKGSRSQRSKFNSHLLSGEVEEALALLPMFYRDFVRCQVDKIYKEVVMNQKDGPDKLSQIDVPIRIKNEKLSLSLPEVWRYRVTESMLHDYYLTLIQDAANFQNTSVITPVAALRENDEEMIEHVYSQNQTMLDLCDMISKQGPSNIYPYYHLYLDSSVFHPSSNVVPYLRDTLEDNIQTEYRGMAVTISSYQAIWEDGHQRQLQQFVSWLNDVCEQNYIPIMAPRSEWYGAFLSDLDVNMFSSLLRKMQEYQDQAGGPGIIESYGSIPDIENSSYLDLLEVDDRLLKHGELTNVPGIEGRPRNYPPIVDNSLEEEIASGSTNEKVKYRFDTAKQYRETFGKPWWLSFIEVSQQLREGRRMGLDQPAKRRFDGAGHPHLS